jgi:hypothetical protein
MEKTTRLKYAAVAHHTAPSIDNVAPLDDYLHSLKHWGQPGPTRKILYLKVLNGVAHVSTQKGISPRATSTAEARAMTDFLYGLALNLSFEGPSALQEAGRALRDLASQPDAQGRVADTDELRACVHQLRVAIDEAHHDPLHAEAVSLQSSSQEAATHKTLFPAVPSAAALVGASAAAGIALPMLPLTPIDLSSVRTRHAGYRALDAARPGTDRSDRESRARKANKPVTESTRLLDSSD